LLDNFEEISYARGVVNRNKSNMVVVYYPSLAKAQDLYVEQGILPGDLTYDELMEAKPLLVFGDDISCSRFERNNQKLAKFLIPAIQITKPFDVVYWCYYKRYNINSFEELLEPSLTAWEKTVIQQLISYNNKLMS
jgi:hypothetical protein